MPLTRRTARGPIFRPDTDAYADVVGTVAAVEGRNLLLPIGDRQVRDTARLSGPRSMASRPASGSSCGGDMRFDAEASTLAAKGVIRLKG